VSEENDVWWYAPWREGGALPGAVLPVAVFLAVKATGGAGLARWERTLVPSAFITKISASPSRRLVKASATADSCHGDLEAAPKRVGVVRRRRLPVTL